MPPSARPVLELAALGETGGVVGATAVAFDMLDQAGTSARPSARRRTEDAHA